VHFDSKKDDGNFICETPKATVVFKKCEKTGFPYVDLDDNSEDLAVTLIQSVHENYRGYTRREVEQAIMARKLQAQAGHPSEKVFKKEVSCKSPHSLFASCPVTTRDISNAKKFLVCRFLAQGVNGFGRNP
jgi:hypothetical protein